MCDAVIEQQVAGLIIEGLTELAACAMTAKFAYSLTNPSNGVS